VEKPIAGTKDLPNRFGSEGPACVTVLQTPSYRTGAFLNIIYFFLSHGKGSETNIVPSST